MKLQPWQPPAPRVFLKGSKIFCVNDHCCGEFTKQVCEEDEVSLILDAIKVVFPHEVNETGWPDPKCRICGGDVLFAWPQTIH